MPTAAAPTHMPKLPAWLPSEVWPFDTTRVDGGGATIAVTNVGAGPVLLFYTGIGSFIWRDVILRLSADFRCVVLDPPGIGLSPSVPRSATTLENSARAVTAVIRALDLRNLTLVVHDTGGPPAIAAGARTPDRIRGLVGINTFAWKPAGRPFRAMLAVMGNGVVRQIDLATGVLARVTSSTFGIGRQLDATARRAYRAGLTQSMGAFHDYLRDARLSDALYDEVTLALVGPFRSLPVLTIFGERNDPLGFQPQWTRLFPDSQQTTIRDGNHFPMCDDPDVVAQTIRSWYRDRLPRSTETRL